MKTFHYFTMLRRPVPAKFTHLCDLEFLPDAGFCILKYFDRLGNFISCKNTLF